MKTGGQEGVGVSEGPTKRGRQKRMAHKEDSKSEREGRGQFRGVGEERRAYSLLEPRLKQLRVEPPSVRVRLEGFAVFSARASHGVDESEVDGLREQGRRVSGSRVR